jgi:hypothetical protein
MVPVVAGNHRLPKGSMTQAYMGKGKHAAVLDRLREVQEAVSAALTGAICKS